MDKVLVVEFLGLILFLFVHIEVRAVEVEQTVR